MSWLALTILSATVVGTIGLFAGAALGHLNRKWPQNNTSLADRINLALPQTQCAQCGYPGCRPYADAIAAGETTIDLCPPGGPTLIESLAKLTGDSADGANRYPEPHPIVARIDEARCIGCARCLEPCPVDAIIGAAHKMHAVIESHCTGCGLCLPPCPVDCIDLVDLPSPTKWQKPGQSACNSGATYE